MLISSFTFAGANFNVSGVIGFTLISVLIAVIASMGFFGARIFSLIFIIGNFIACCYELYIVLSKKSDGWSDLASFASFIVILLFSTVLALIIQVIFMVLGKKK